MRWGVRKDRSKKISKKLKKMSDDELRQNINRLMLERQYRELTKKEVSPGKKWVTEVMSTSGKAVAQKYVAKYMDKGVDSLIKEAAKIHKAKKDSS